jgi:hypothetical protein
VILPSITKYPNTNKKYDISNPFDLRQYRVNLLNSILPKISLRHRLQNAFGDHIFLCKRQTENGLLFLHNSAGTAFKLNDAFRGRVSRGTIPGVRVSSLYMAASDKKGRVPEWKEEDLLSGLKDTSASKLRDEFVDHLVCLMKIHDDFLFS